MNEESEKILSRVRGLLAKAEDPACTPQEAEAFSAKAEELIAKYAIDTALLEAKEHSGTATLRSYPMPNPYGKAKAGLFNGIAEAHGCKLVRKREWSNGEYVATLQMVGFESDLDVVELLYTSLLLQGTNALLHQPRSDRTFRTSYWYGFASRAAQRIREIKERTVREETEARGTGTALVLRQRSAEVDQAFREHFPRVRKGSAGRVRSRDGYGAGQTAANRADLGGRQVGGYRAALQ